MYMIIIYFNVLVDRSLKIFSITEKIQKRSATISNLVRKISIYVCMYIYMTGLNMYNIHNICVHVSNATIIVIDDMYKL